MKKTITVTIEKEIEVDIPDEMLTDEAFVEGIGRVDYKEPYEDVTTEIIECSN